MSRTERPALLIVLGPTGSGKSELAHEIARRREGEIVSADAFAVYRGFDIGTDKPSRQRRAEVPYHFIDVAEAEETFSAGRWAREARQAIDSIASRGRLPIVCGGSGFYVSALLEPLGPGMAAHPGLRSGLTAWGKRDAGAAHRFLSVNDPVSAARIPPGNLRYVLRAVEILLETGARPSERERKADAWVRRWRTIKVGLRSSREDLYARIAARVLQMLEAGWEEEVRGLLESRISLASNAFQAIGYREVAEWVLGREGRLTTQGKIVAATRQLAKRQGTWLARELDVEWVSRGDALSIALARLDGAAMERNG